MNRQKLLAFLKAIVLIGIYGGLLVPAFFGPHFNINVIFPFVFSKLIFFQILIGVTFPAYVALAWMEPKYRLRMHWLYAAIVAYMAAVGLSVVFAVDPMRAWWGNQERMNGLFSLLHFFAWLTMAVGLLHRWENWRRLLNFEVGVSAYMSLWAIGQKLNPNILGFPAGSRVGALVDNPIYMAAYQIFNLFFLALLFLKTPSRTARIVYGVIAILDITAFVLAQSRGGLVGLGIGIIVFAVFYALFASGKKIRYGLLAGVAALFTFYGVLFAFRTAPIVQNSPFERLTNFSVSKTRLIAWDIAWQGFLERPLTGWGFDNFHILFNSHYNPQSLRFGQYETWFDRSHNTILDVLSMTGIAGFLAYAGIYVTLFWSVWRAYRKQWIDLPIAAILIALPAAYFVQNLFVFDHPAAFTMSYLLFAIIIAATRGEFLSTAPAVETGAEKKRNFPLYGFIGVQTAALMLVWMASVQPLRASLLAIRSNAMFGTPKGFEAAKQASDIWTPYVDEQAFLLARNFMGTAAQGSVEKVYQWKEQYALAKRLAEEELRRHPKNTHPNLLYAQLLATMARFAPEDIQKVDPQYAKALETSPKRQQSYYNLASFYFSTNRVPQGIDLYRKVRDMDPDFGGGYWNYGQLLLSLDSKSSEGIEMIGRSQEVSVPYRAQNVQELSQIFEALRVLGNTDRLPELLKRLPELPPTEPSLYARFAYQYERVGMTAERDAVLKFGSGVNPLTSTVYEDIKSGYLNQNGERVLSVPGN